MNAARAAVAARGAMLVVALAIAACTSGQGDRRDPKATADGARWTTRIESGASGRDVPAPSAARTVVASVAIATGSSRATNFRIGRDLEQFVAPAAGIDLDVLATNGSADNLHRLADDPRVDLAIVQYDVLRAMSDEARGGDRRAARLIDPVRIVLPLYTEEIHFVVRRDSPLKTVDDIRGKRINLGVQGSGSALTATALYRRMFHAPVAPANASYLSDEQALAALTLDRSVDVVVVVAAQPAQLFSDMKSAARNYIRLLPIGDDTPATKEASKVYLPTTIRARNYASWLTQDVRTLSVVSFLVTTERRDNALTPHLSAFTRALCDAYPVLASSGHPKWREVRLNRHLDIGLPYVSASETELNRCSTS